MSLRNRLNAIANRVRAIPSKPSIDERTTSVTVRTRTHVGGRRGADGPKNDVDLVLAPRPRVRDLNTREVASSGGRYAVGDVRVGPITPVHPGGGYTEAELAPTAETGIEIIYVLAGGVTGEYARVDLTTDRSHSWFLILRRRRSSP